MRKALGVVALVVFLLSACSGGGGSTAGPARHACEVLKKAGDLLPGSRFADVERAAKLLRQAQIRGAREIAAHLDALRKEPNSLDASQAPIEVAWEDGTRWCFAHDLPADSNVLAAPPATTPTTTTPAIPITTLAEACAKVDQLAQPGVGNTVDRQTMVALRSVFASVPDPLLRGAMSGGPTSEVGTQLQAMFV